MKYIGAHVEGYPEIEQAPLSAEALGATAFALNITDAARFSVPKLDPKVAELFKSRCAELGFGPGQILPHGAFVVNLCSPDARKLQLSRIAMGAELDRAAQLGLSMVNFHPGSTLGQMSDDEGIKLVAESINRVLEKSSPDVTCVLENAAGQGSSLGYSFEQLGAMIEGVEDKTRVGVCIDTAHAFAAGYDFSTREGYDASWRSFDENIGLSYLRGMHINDSQRLLSSRIDRHAPLGLGTIGYDCFKWLMEDPRLDNIPFILETPDAALWIEEIALLREIAESNN